MRAHSEESSFVKCGSQVLPKEDRASATPSAGEPEPSANIHQTLRDFPEQKMLRITRKNIPAKLVHMRERRRIYFDRMALGDFSSPEASPVLAFPCSLETWRCWWRGRLFNS
jgi:hypothetical protein